MTDRNKNKKESLSEFIRYKNGEMSGEERNSFEKELQKDPFAEEAAEGFALISSTEDISKDIVTLNKQIRFRTANRKRFIYYSIAASVAVLMVISSVYVIINKNNSTKQIAEATPPEKSSPVKEDKPSLTTSVPAEMIKSQNNKGAEKNLKKEDNKNQITLADATRGAGAGVMVKDSEVYVSDSVTELKMDNISASVSEMKAAVPMAARAKAVTTNLFSTGGKVISSEDNMPVPGAIISLKGTNNSVLTDTGGNFTIALPDSSSHTLTANFIGMESKEFAAKADSKTELKLDPDATSLSEVVVVGYGVRKADYDEAEGPSGYIPPQPYFGKSAFNKYIGDNIIKPDSLPAGQRVVVVVNIIVHSDGSLGEIKIVRSPGKIFSAEAVRLIQSGPKWKPASDGGKLIDDEVKVRIVFK
jgi:hypothetical protein